MSILDKNKIDFVGIDKQTDKAIFTISDHLDWSEETKHLFLLQEKIKSYIASIEGDDLKETDPDFFDRSKEINVKFKYPPPLLAIGFLEDVKMTLFDIGVDLTFELF